MPDASRALGSGEGLGAEGLERSRRLVLGAMLERAARKSPDTTAVVFGDSTLTFHELDARVNRLANGLHGLGVRRRDRVAVLMYNSLEVIEAYFACAKLGAICVPLNFRLTVSELTHILSDSRARVLVARGELVEIAALVSRETPIARVVGDGTGETLDYETLLATSSSAPPGVDVRENDIAFLMYTSGTTGFPKGAMLSHLNLMTNTSNWIIEMQARPGDTWLSGLPLFHIGGLNGVLPCIYLVGTCVITESMGFNASESLTQLERFGVTACYFVPTQWQQLCEVQAAEPVDTSRLRRALWGASVASPGTLEAMIRTFPDVGFASAFGQTEMSSNTAFLQPSDAVTKLGSVGRIAVNVEYRIVDDDGCDVRPGEIGEIVYRGPTVMYGYFNNPEATEAAFTGGWFHSGDLVREDAEGFIWVIDRKKDLIVSGGENIYPAEVERAFESHAGVREVAVFGVAHEKWVETPVAAVVVDDAELTVDELMQHIREQLASYKKPSDIVFVDALPRNAAGKVLRRELRKAYEEAWAKDHATTSGHGCGRGNG